MDFEEIAADIEAFIRERFRIAPDDHGFSRSSSLWENGYVDSIGVVELIGHLESTFGISLPDAALFDPNFTSVDGMARIVSDLATQRAA